MSTDPQEFAQVLNELLEGVIVCSDKLCHIEPTPPANSDSYINLKDPSVKVKVLGSRDCKPCTELKTAIGTHPKVSFIYMDDEKDPNAELGFEILEKAGWSGTTPAIFFEQNGQVIGELWEGAREREPGVPFEDEDIAELEETPDDNSLDSSLDNSFDSPEVQDLTQELVDESAGTV